MAITTRELMNMTRHFELNPLYLRTQLVARITQFPDLERDF